MMLPATEAPAPATTVPINLRRGLIELGWNDRAIGRMLRSGQWVRVRHGAYCDAQAWKQLDHAGQHLVRTRAVLMQAQTDLVVSHASALPWYDAPTWRVPLVDVDVTRPDGRIGRHEAGVHQHRGRVAKGDRRQRGDVTIMSPTRVVLEVSTQVSIEPALVVANDLLHRGLTTPEELAQRYREGECPMELWPQTLGTDLVLRLAQPKCESVGETRTWFFLWSHHLPMPVPQFEVKDDRGKVIATLDFAWPDLGCFLEFDGKVKYEKLLKPGERASDVVIREKRREERVCRRTGWRCLRLVWADLEHPERTAKLIRDFLAGRPV